MSRIGKMPITVPGGTTVEVKDDHVHVSGPKGKISQPLVPGIEIRVDGETIELERSGDTGPDRAMHGLARSLVANAVTGVSEGFEKVLEVVGVGYRGEMKGNELHLSLGFSHPVVYAVPDGIEVDIDKANRITVRGADKQRVGQVAAEIRGLRSPDSYKGKGIRYAGEHVRLKEGKAGAKGA